MASNKRSLRKRASGAKPARKGRPSGSSQTSSAITRALDAVSERLDMMLPELITRVAAIEHLLIEQQMCSREDLVRSRQFIDEQEGT